MTEPVRWGVLGGANIAVEKVIPAMRSSELSRVVAIASRTGERAAEVAAALGIPTAHTGYERLLSDPDVEAVYIPLPNHLHAEWAIAAARAGKHVLCEKPLATTSSDARAMVAAAGDAGVKLMEAFMYRLHPLWVAAKGLVDDGSIGEVMAVQSFFSYRNTDPADIRNIAEFGGGALFDIGCYPVNAARLIFGSEPSRVVSAVHRLSPSGTDVLTSALLDFNGRHATFTCSTVLESDQRVEIVGTAGRLVVEIPFNIPPDRATRLLQVSGGEPPAAPGIQVHEFAVADQYAIQADAFSRAIREETPVPTPPTDAVANLEVLEAIFEEASH